MTEGNDDAKVLEILGGDERVMRLLEIALTAYKFLPGGMINLTTGRPTRKAIIDAIEAFGFRAADIPWERFPKRFHQNRPQLQLFRGDLTDAAIEQHWAEVIAAQPPDAPRRRAKRGGAKSSTAADAETGAPAGQEAR